jgi:hypothetical protein
MEIETKNPDSERECGCHTADKSENTGMNCCQSNHSLNETGDFQNHRHKGHNKNGSNCNCGCGCN